MYPDRTLPTSDSHGAGTCFAKAILCTVTGFLRFTTRHWQNHSLFFTPSFDLSRKTRSTGSYPTKLPCKWFNLLLRDWAFPNHFCFSDASQVVVVQLSCPSLEMAFWTQLTMSFGCFHFPASGRRSLCARITTSRLTTGTDAARRLCRSTDRLEPGSSWQHAGNHGSPATASRRRWRRTSQPNAVVKIFLSAMNDPKMERPWAWCEQAVTVESRDRPASCDAISKSITYTTVTEHFLVKFKTGMSK